ncbi:HicB_like antitoxin of bacterial toxin-antitoxin system [anaerobic digester metagenome]
MAAYIAIIHKEQDDNFGLLFPDFPGCVTSGRSFEEVALLAKEALALHVKGMREDGESIPNPCSIEQAKTSDLAEGAELFQLVELPEEHKTVRVNITLSENDLKEIDNYAQGEGLSRSSFLVLAAKKVIFQNRIERELPSKTDLFQSKEHRFMEEILRSAESRRSIYLSACSAIDFSNVYSNLQKITLFTESVRSQTEVEKAIPTHTTMKIGDEISCKIGSAKISRPKLDAFGSLKTAHMDHKEYDLESYCPSGEPQ